MKRKKKIAFVLISVVFAIICFAALRIYQHFINDNAYPVITFEKGTPSFSTSATESELLKGVTATDAEDGDVTDSVIVAGYSRMIGDANVKVEYVAFDSNNHVTQATRVVHFTDYKSPHFTLSLPLVCKESDVENIINAVGAVDDIDGDLSSKVKVIVTDKSTLSKNGEHTLEFRVTNSLGETVYLPVSLEIVNSSYNTAKITLKDYLVYIKKGSEFNAENYVVSYLRDGNLQEDASGLRIESDVDTSTPGTYEVTYRYGNGSSSSYTKLVVIVE